MITLKLTKSKMEDFFFFKVDVCSGSVINCDE